MIGTFYGIGLGPGDRELVTMRAYKTLKKVKHIYAPRSSDEKGSIALSILKELLGEEVSYEEITFPMISEEIELKRRWDEIIGTIVARLYKGEDLALIALGDPLLYSTYAHILKGLKEREPLAPIITVPGITSFSAASAALNLPQALGEERLAVIPATIPEEKIEEVVKDFDTIIFLKISSSFSKILSILEKYHLKKNSILIQRCGLAREKVFYDLTQIKGEDIEYLSLIITKKGR